MSELITENTGPAATAAARAPETVKKKATRGARAPRAAKPEGKPGKKTTSVNGAPKAAPKARNAKAPKAGATREGSKTETILGLLKRPGGAALKELMKATSWQAHSVRGFLSAVIGKKMGLTVASTKTENGDRTYSVEA
jgi:hypothetical protein